MKVTLIASLLLISASAHASYFSKGSWVGRLFSEPLTGEAAASGARFANVPAPGDVDFVGPVLPIYPRVSGSFGHHVTSALGPFAMFADGSSASAQTPAKRGAQAADENDDDEFGEEAGGDEKPISPENLAALMKHPTEPHYDLLRPLSGAWGHCEPTSAEAGVQSIQDRFASSDRTHLTRSIIKASDSACKTPISETRTSLVCNETGKGAVACKAQKQETRTFVTDALPTSADTKAANPTPKGATPYAPVSLSAAQLQALDLKLGFSGSKKKKHSKKHRRGHSRDRDEDEMDNSNVIQTSADGKERHLDLRVTPAAGGETTTYRLEFLPEVAAAALEPAPPAPTRSKKRATKD